MFDEHYEAVIADTALGRRIHHRIRYAVYCLEADFEHPNLFPDGEERDAWDQHSVHLLARHRGSGQWVGATRLIRPANGGLLPIHTLVSGHLPGPGQGVAEVSRLCVLGDHRRATRPGQAPLKESLGQSAFALRSHVAPLPFIRSSSAGPETRSPRNRCHHEGTASMDQLRGPEILAGLLRAAMEYSRDHGINHWYFLTTPSLVRLVARMKVDLVRIGEACHHRGLRHPYLVDLNHAAFTASRRCPRVARLLAEGQPYRLFSEIIPEERRPLQIIAAA